MLVAHSTEVFSRSARAVEAALCQPSLTVFPLSARSRHNDAKAIDQAPAIHWKSPTLHASGLPLHARLGGPT